MLVLLNEPFSTRREFAIQGTLGIMWRLVWSQLSTLVARGGEALGRVGFGRIGIS